MKLKSFFYYPLLVVYVMSFYGVFVIVKLLTLLNIPKRKVNVVDKSVLFLECMGPPSAGYRHRSQGWVNEFQSHGVKAESWYVIPYNKQWKLQQTPEGMLRLHLIYLFKRFGQCVRSASFNTVVVRRELLLYNDYGNLFFEKWMRRIHNNLILDVDDDISAAKREPRIISSFGKIMLEHPQKFKSSLHYFDKVVAASDYLKQLFLSWGNGLVDSDVLVVPSCVDYYKHHRKDYSVISDNIKIGWVGSAYNLPSLYTVYPALEELTKSFSLELVVVCNEEPKKSSLPIKFIQWSEANELDNLMQIDIGIMPMNDNDISKGKGGFKLIQYMGCGIVSVATGLTINEDIVDDGENGFLVYQNDWVKVLSNVLQRKSEFEIIGARAAETIRQRFSYEAHLDNYLRLIGATSTENSIPSNHQGVL